MPSQQTEQELDKERYRLLIYVEKLFEIPMIILGIIWLIILILEFTNGLNRSLEITSLVIWVIFIIDFIIKFIIAPLKLTFLKKNVLTIISLIIPAFRIARVLRFARFLRTFRLAKVIGTVNRNMRSLNQTLKKRAIGYVTILTSIVILAGGAAMYAFERNQPGSYNDYLSAVWWTSMLIITMGTDYWPKSTEGRVLAFMIALYGFAILGYVTATIATFFIGKDHEESLENKQNKILRKNISELQQDMKLLLQKFENKTKSQ